MERYDAKREGKTFSYDEKGSGTEKSVGRGTEGEQIKGEEGRAGKENGRSTSEEQEQI